MAFFAAAAAAAAAPGRAVETDSKSERGMKTEEWLFSLAICWRVSSSRRRTAVGLCSNCRAASSNYIVIRN